MRRRFQWIFGLAATWHVAAAADLSPRDFAFGQPVIAPKDAAVYRFTVPLAVYRNTAREDLGDLRLFNAAGEAVPYALFRPAPPSPVHEAPSPLPLFPLRGNARVVIDGVRLTIDTPATAINLQAQGSGPSVAVNQYILDGRAIPQAVSALRLNWPDTAADYSGRVKIESSDDLGAWQTLVTAAPTANLHANGQALIENRVTFAPARAKYWRLSWVGPAPPFELTSVLAERADTPVESPRDSLEVAGTTRSSEADAALFDLDAHLPVTRVNVMLPDTNTIDTIELASRRAATEPWRIVAQGGFYRLKAPDGERQNAPVSLGVDRDRYWRARVVRGGVPQAPLRLRVEWEPNEITFLARGPGPFLLVYGNSSAGGAESDLSPVPAGVEIASATLGAQVVLGGADRLQQSRLALTQRSSLWGVLLAAVGLLCWMTYRLARDRSPG